MMDGLSEQELLINRVNRETVRLYRYRWVILALYSITAFSNTLMWLSLFTVTDATCKFYGVSETIFLWSSNAFTFLQVLIAFPMSFVPSRFGLRTSMTAAAAVNAVGASIMIAGAHPNGFWYFVSGQCVISISACLLPQLAPDIAAVWFGEREQATATSIGIIVGNLGAAVGFLQPALLIKDIDVGLHLDLIGEKLKQLIYSQASLCILMLILVVILFKEKPLRPPSVYQANRNGPGGISFVEFVSAVKKLLKNINFHLAGNAFALSSALMIVVPVILNAMIAWQIPHRDATTGWMGFSGVMIGLLSSILFGYVLDKTRAFKKLAVLLSFTSLLFWVLFAEVLAQVGNMAAVFSLFVLALFVFIPFGPIVVDMTSEMTYPVPSSIAYVIPITVGRVYSIVMIFLAGWMMENGKQHAVCLLIAGVILICTILVACTKVERRRTEDSLVSSNSYSDRSLVT